jgi:hypothetical protein
MRTLAFLFAMILLTVPGISMGMEEIITGPDWESPFVDRDPNDPLDNADDDLSFTPAETESGQVSPSMTLTSARESKPTTDIHIGSKRVLSLKPETTFSTAW